MDHIAIVIIALSGLFSFVLLTLMRGTPIFFDLFAWVVAIPALGFNAVSSLLKTDIWSATTWTGQAEIGPVSLLLATMGLSLWFIGGAIDGTERI